MSQQATWCGYLVALRRNHRMLSSNRPMIASPHFAMVAKPKFVRSDMISSGQPE